jgi:preprotein translocase subunit SecG
MSLSVAGVRSSARVVPKLRVAAVQSSAMVPLLVVIDVISALALIALVLMHSGRGGGLSDMFGGGMGASAAGSTVIEKNLDRITVVVALIFTFVTLALALMMDE